MLYCDREKLGSIMDAELCLESEADQLHHNHHHQPRFKFMAGLACYHSSHVKHMTQVHADAGSLARDRVFVIPQHITNDHAVLECLQFYLMTSILVDVRSITKQGTIPIQEALTYQAVKYPEFSFDLLVGVIGFIILQKKCDVAGNFFAEFALLSARQDLYQAAAYLRMHQLTKKLREHCLIGTSADASYERSERMLACLIAR